MPQKSVIGYQTFKSGPAGARRADVSHTGSTSLASPQHLRSHSWLPRLWSQLSRLDPPLIRPSHRPPSPGQAAEARKNPNDHALRAKRLQSSPPWIPAESLNGVSAFSSSGKKRKERRGNRPRRPPVFVVLLHYAKQIDSQCGGAPFWG